MAAVTHGGRSGLSKSSAADAAGQRAGRVERNHGTHQDRLVKKMRLKKIATYAQANEYLEREYLAEHNRRFAQAPASEKDYHHPAPKRRELQAVFYLETQRVIGNDWVVRYENRYFQVQRQARRYAPAKATVKVCTWEDGRLEIQYRGQALSWQEIAAPVAAPVPNPNGLKPNSARRKPPTPGADHPWRGDYRKMRPWSKTGSALPNLSGVASASC